MINLFYVLLFINATLSQCTKGCLKCNSKNECQICDFVQFYKLDKNKCVLVDIPKCEIIDIDGKCLQCFSNFYPDADKTKCLPIETPIVGCKISPTKETCGGCLKNYYLIENKCFLATNLINNCQIYKKDGECLECDHSFILSDGGTRCVLGQTEPNCQFYSQTFCKSCAKTYVKNYSLNSDLIFKFDTDDQKRFLVGYMKDVYYSKTVLKYGQVCKKTEVANCMMVKAYNKCYFCDLGYYLNTEEKCTRYPIPRTNNCMFYNPIFQCQECENGFMLTGGDTSKICVSNTPINKCLFYNGKENKTICRECETDYYLKNNTCVARVISKQIENCLEIAIDQDSCKKCAQGFVNSSDNFKCFKKIDNCMEYSNNFSSSNEITCKTCDDFYYLKTSVSCSLGLISNCKVYVAEKNCKECEVKYYLQGGNCVLSLDIANCETYSKLERDTCVFCNSFYYNFKLNQICLAGKLINNCREYNGNTKENCNKCDIGFYLENNTCKAITKDNCLDVDNGVCKACKKNFGLEQKSFDTICSPLPNSVLENCIKNSTEDDLNLENVIDGRCLACSESSIPIDHREQFVCIENSRLSLFNLTDNKLKDFCIKYDFEQNCIQCENGKFLTATGNCADKCLNNSVGNYYKLQLGASSTNNFIIKAYNICVIDKVDFCEAVGINQESSYICLKCSENYMNIVDFTFTLYSLIDGFSTQLPYIMAPVSQYPEVTCTKTDDINIATINGSNLNSLIENCLYYKELTKTGTKVNYGCVRCIFGFSGPVSSSGFIISCSKMDQCKTDQLYGLDKNFEEITSCHVCQDRNTIPFIMMKAVSLTNPTPNVFSTYSFTTLNWTSAPDITKKNILCLESAKNSFGYPANSTLFQMPDNCGIGFVNLLYTSGDCSNNKTAVTGASITNLAIYCGACKPKYRATPISTTYQYIKIKCDLIEHCADSVWFNFCSKCETGYVYEWTESKINYDKCIANPIVNCFAGTSDTISECRACEKGYNLNPDFACEQYKPSNCESASDFNLKSNYFAHPFYSYYHNQNGLGCNKCRTGFTAVEISPTSLNTFLCTNSNYLVQNKANFKDNSKFIANCLNYTIENNLFYCAKCENGSIFFNKNNVRKCVIALEGCVDLETETRCKQCKAGYSLVNNICQQGNISNCKDYNTDTNNGTQICVNCQKEYYKSIEGKCETGFVRNCDKLLDFIPNKCLVCTEGYFLVQKTKVDYCYPIPPEINCQKINVIPNLKYGGELTCTDCKNPYNYLTNDLSKIQQLTRCFPFTKVENCKSYDSTPELLNSTFFCKECEKNFYLEFKEQLCKPRTYQDANCEIYFPVVDKCQKCSINTMQTYEGYCADLPSGINGCIQYSDKVECLTCNKDLYLEDGLCKTVKVLIPNCRFYYGDGNCKTCDDGYFFTNNECLIAKAKNCKTFTDIATCKECDPTRGLVLDSNGALSCVEIKKPNCTTFKQIDGFPCDICNKNYYPDDQGNCVIASKLIQGCEQYQSELKCAKCQKDMALKSDQSGCLTLMSITKDFDYNCEDSIEKYKCSMCRPGAYFQGEQCILCVDSDGCFRCNPEDPKTCLICNSGYFMDKGGKCWSFASALDSKNGSDPSTKKEALSEIWLPILLSILMNFF